MAARRSTPRPKAPQPDEAQSTTEPVPPTPATPSPPAGDVTPPPQDVTGSKAVKLAEEAKEAKERGLTTTTNLVDDTPKDPKTGEPTESDPDAIDATGDNVLADAEVSDGRAKPDPSFEEVKAAAEEAQAERDALQAKLAEAEKERDAAVRRAGIVERQHEEYVQQVQQANLPSSDVIAVNPPAPPEQVERMVRFRAKQSREGVTYGAGNVYNFKAGETYEVPQSLYDWLDDRDLVWH